MTASQKVETAAVNLGALLDAGEGAVVTLVAGDTSLVAHRAVLAARSPVLAAVLVDDSPKARNKEVIIGDVEGAVLRDLVAYLYTLQAPQPAESTLQLLVAADWYGVPGLKAECERQLVANLTVENVATAAVLAVRYHCPDLKRAAVTFIKAHTHQVMATQGWADAMLDRPQDLLEVSQLLLEPAVETSRPSAGTQGQSQGNSSKTAPAAALPTASPSGGALGSQMGSTSGKRSRSQRNGKTPVTPAPPVPPPSDDKSGSRTRPTAGTQGQHQSDGSEGPVAAALPVSSHAGGSSISQLRGLPAEEKGRRLIKAAEEGEVKELKKLLAAGTDVMVRDGDESTALHIAARDGLLEAVESLLENGAEVDARDQWQFTPLHWAAQYGHVDVIRLLVDSAADIEAKDMHGGTPLHLAAYVGQEDAVAALLKEGADWMAKDEGGNMPLDLARFSANKEVIEMLYCYSYDPSDFS